MGLRLNRNEGNPKDLYSHAPVDVRPSAKQVDNVEAPAPPYVVVRRDQ